MFYLRGLLVSMSAFVLVYVGWSVLVGCLWRMVYARTRRLAPSSAANALYGFRISPIVVGLAVVLGFTVPSFLRYEPRGNGEAMGVIPVVLGAVFVMLSCCGGHRAWKAHKRTQNAIREWMTGARRVECRQLEYFEGGSGSPPIAMAGISRPALIVSAATSRVLSAQELSVSVEHELSHLRAHDNLKKLVLQACAFPFMRGLERVWRDAVEYSADAGAVHSETEALDLASALVKVSRLAGGRALPELASGLAEGSASLLQGRVERLMTWRPQPPRGSLAGPLASIAAVAGATALAVNYPGMLRGAHLLTEFLVR